MWDMSLLCYSLPSHTPHPPHRVKINQLKKKKCMGIGREHSWQTQADPATRQPPGPVWHSLPEILRRGMNEANRTLSLGDGR